MTDETTVQPSDADGPGVDETGDVHRASESERIGAWLRGRLPAEWTATAPEVVVDREEISVVVTIPESAAGGSGDDGELAAEEASGRITRFREDTRAARVAIAQEAERRFGRKVAWGARAGSVTEVFTNLAIPVMTRLRQSERLILDTLVDSGVARSRAHALAWCVRLVGQHSSDWLGDLRRAMAEVERVRATGPA